MVSFLRALGGLVLLVGIRPTTLARSFQLSVALTGGNNQLGDTPYPAVICSYLQLSGPVRAGARGAKDACEPDCFSGRTKRMAGIRRTCDWPIRR